MLSSSSDLHTNRYIMVMDAVTVINLLFCVASPCFTTPNAVILLSTYGVVFAMTRGKPSNHWPVTFPMMPLLVLQILRRMAVHWYLGSVIISLLSWICMIMMVLLRFLFPVHTELKPVRGKYDVGVVDTHLQLTEKGDECVCVRMLYPTQSQEKKSFLPYLDPEWSTLFCSEQMKCGGAPAPLNTMAWFLHPWRRIRIRAFKEAPPILEQKMPIVVYSHGLYGSPVTYTYQGLSLAANGNLVLMIHHMDGSSPVVKRRDGSFLYLDTAVGELDRQKKTVEYARARRSQTEFRVNELLSATLALIDLNRTNIPTLEAKGVSFRGKLRTDNITFMGHSFGAATAISAAVKRPDLVSTVIAHDPAMDWVTDEGRRALFAEERLELANVTYHGGTGGYCTLDMDREFSEEEKKENDVLTSDPTEIVKMNRSLHDHHMFFLYCEQWAEKGWECSKILKQMHQKGQLGSNDSVADVSFVAGTCHQEFSDACALTPVWLARALGMTGKRDPNDTLEEIAQRTLDFIEQVNMTKG